MLLNQQNLDQRNLSRLLQDEKEQLLLEIGMMNRENEKLIKEKENT